MIQQERHEYILHYLDDRKFMAVRDAGVSMGASAATVRRDFKLLAEQGLVERTRGGVKRVATASDGSAPFALRQTLYSEEKAALACAASALLSPEDVIIVDGGTSTFHLAGCLPDFALRVITNSLRLAVALGDRRGNGASVDVHLTGGYLFPESGLLVGPLTVRTIEEYHANWAFLSASGVNSEGVFNANELVVESEQVMMRRAEKVVVLADYSKIGARSMCRVSGLDAVDILITNERPESEAGLREMEELGVEVIRV